MNETKQQFIVRNLTAHNDSLYRYVFSLVGNDCDTRDVMQETSLALLNKADQLDPTRPFLPWAYRFAYHEVLSYRKRCRRDAVTLDDDVVELLAVDRAGGDGWFQRRAKFLPDCVRRLSEADQRLLRGRYYQQTDGDFLAKSLGLSRRTMYRQLERVRRSVSRCIEMKLEAEDV